MQLSKLLQKIIQESVRKTFTDLRLNLLGPDRVSKAMTFSFKRFDPATTIGSMYTHANAINSTNPNSIDKKTLNKIKDVAENYIDALEQKSLADLTRIVAERLDDAETKAKIQGIDASEVLKSKDGKQILIELRKTLKDQKIKIDKAAEVIANHELHNAQNFGAFDGLLSAAKSMGIQDPTVFKIGVLDEHRCSICKKLWSIDGGVVPKVYKLSELSGSPGNWKNPVASISPSHPNCREIISILLPGFGLDENGKIIYVGNNHNEFDKQRK